MKIAVATDDEVMVTGHVGRCNAFIVYTIEEDNISHKEVRENTFTNHKRQNHHEEHHHGGGNAHGQGHSNLITALADCEALIFTSGGWRLVEELKANNINPVLTDESIANEAALKYASGTLQIKDDNICNRH